jgi:hypothetical protein
MYEFLIFEKNETEQAEDSGEHEICDFVRVIVDYEFEKISEN